MGSRSSFQEPPRPSAGGGPLGEVLHQAGRPYEAERLGIVYAGPREVSIPPARAPQSAKRLGIFLCTGRREGRQLDIRQISV